LKEVPEEAWQDIKEATLALGKIPGVIRINIGQNISSSSSPLSKNYTHALVATFKDEATLKVYNDHPEHITLKKKLEPYRTDIAIIDFVAQ